MPSKGRKTGKSNISFWLTALVNRAKERFVMKGYSFYEHPAVKGLSPSAYKIYDYMCKECGGTVEFIFPASKYEQITTKPTFQSAKKELIAKGFIIEVQNNSNLRKPNIFRFSDEWKRR